MCNGLYKARLGGPPVLHILVQDRRNPKSFLYTRMYDRLIFPRMHPEKGSIVSQWYKKIYCCHAETAQNMSDNLLRTCQRDVLSDLLTFLKVNVAYVQSATDLEYHVV